MSLTTDEYIATLVKNILVVGSQKGVEQSIDKAIKIFEEDETTGHAIDTFIDKVITELNLFNPMQKNAQQWSNISRARVILNRIKNRRSTLKN